MAIFPNFLYNLLSRLREIGSGNTKKGIPEPENKFESKNTMGILPGRSTRAEQELRGTEGFAVVHNKYYDEQLLETMENLAVFNRHVSLAADNIVTMGHTNSILTISDQFPDRQKRLMRQHLERVQSCWYAFNQNESMLDAQRFFQAGVYGAVSTEAEIMSTLRGINTVHLVTPRYIRFKWDKELGVNIPIQIGLHGGSNAPIYKELNGNQYHYTPIKTMGENPYAIPPFLSALDDIDTEESMIKNIRHIMKQIGLLGFLSILIEQPEQDDGETDEAYQGRLAQHIQEAGEIAEPGFMRGFNVGYKDIHEFELKGTNINANGADKLMEVVNGLEFEGLKQNPMFFGRNLSGLGEAQSKILVKIASKQITKIQEAVAFDKAKKASLELYLAGFPPLPSMRNISDNRGDLSSMYGLKYEFERPFDLDEEERAKTRTTKIVNAVKERDEGFITQDEAAESLGHKKAAFPEPISRNSESTEEPESKNSVIKPQSITYNRVILKGIDRLKKRFKSEIPIFDYDLPEHYIKSNGAETFFIGFRESKLQRQFKKYTSEVVDNYTGVYDAARPRIKTRIKNLDENSTSETLFSSIYFEILTHWQNEFINKNKEVIKENVTDIYETNREDKSIFSLDTKSVEKFDDVDDAIFDFRDFNAIDYLERGDGLFLGKFITDPQTEEKFRNWVNEIYLSDNNPVGKTDKLIEQFLDEFGELFEYEAWKIVRVIATTTNRARNIANLFYINQLQVEEYEIVEVMDSRTCPWCMHLNGKVFKTERSVSWMDSVIESDFSDINRIAPFATSTKIDDFTSLNAKELQEVGVMLPAFHPHCRGRIVSR